MLNISFLAIRYIKLYSEIISSMRPKAKLAKLSESHSFASKLIFLLGQSKIEKECEWCGLGIVFLGVSGEIRDFGPIS